MSLNAPASFVLANRHIQTELPSFIMGIVNVTPDSFWSASRKTTLPQTIDFALSLIAAGADIIDIGGESSRPGADYVDEEEEIERIIPVIRELRRQTSCPISVDTRKKSVFERAFDCGADILNDISALEDDDSLGKFCAQSKTPVILMHKRGIPAIMQKQTWYENVVCEVLEYLCSRKRYALECGIENGRIVVDPGIGFGKDTGANIELIKNCGYFARELDCPVLIGLSRKSFIGICGCGEDRLAGTLAANQIAVQAGATFLRVHDVHQTADMLKILKYMGD